MIGIDCSTNIRRNGLVRGQLIQGGLQITDLVLGRVEQDFVEKISEWVFEADRVLLCLDAPLG